MKTERTAAGLTIQVDHGRCSGMSYCRDSMPELFVVEERRSWLREDFDLAGADRQEIEETAEECPWFAITVSGTE